MKRKKKSDLTNLVDMDVDVLALVDKGANDKTFHLFKRKENSTMDKKLAIKLLKSGDLTEDERKEILDQVSEDDRAEVEKAVEDTMEKAGAKFNKDVLTKLESMFKLLQGILGKQKEEEEEPEKDKKKVEKEDKDDPELTDEEYAELVKEEIEYEIGGKERPKTKPEEVIAQAIKDLAGNK